LTDNINRVRVLIRIDRRTPVRTNTEAVVSRRFVTGIAKIDLETPDPPGPPLIAVPLHEPYSVIPEGTSNLDAIANRLNKVGETAAETLERLNEVLKPRTAPRSTRRSRTCGISPAALTSASPNSTAR